jgi:hypothetical protein
MCFGGTVGGEGKRERAKEENTRSGEMKIKREETVKFNMEFACQMIAPQDPSPNGRTSTFPRQNTNLFLNGMKFCAEFY